MKHLLVIALTIPGIATFAQEDFKPYNQNVQGTSVNFKMVPIPAGKFKMGSPDAQPGHQPDESPQKEVAVSAFWMAALETTHDEFGVFWTDQTVTINSTVDAVTRPTSQYIDLSWGMGKDGGFPSTACHKMLHSCMQMALKETNILSPAHRSRMGVRLQSRKHKCFPWGDDPKELNKYAWNKSNSKNKYQKTGTLNRMPGAL
jgi:formylglycine-generating enzyme required for sulfatase activity